MSDGVQRHLTFDPAGIDLLLQLLTSRASSCWINLTVTSGNLEDVSLNLSAVLTHLFTCHIDPHEQISNICPLK